ncbi:L,D-transpeptidase [Lusitaniella coriacea LEGE 07157]|uniref:L,D-transpeptidase n=1 Tax=Lusitaniella coriacea LEGE 07157 TaxID=945747 RepID=A0A8J7DNV8_9CYAN|nr:L,D-transpeptidase [Lusitaniella coriacea]MBE9115254.1 L,D-transpeptidase [Lusitaniella coriacea LEGE 07157]
MSAWFTRNKTDFLQHLRQLNSIILLCSGAAILSFSGQQSAIAAEPPPELAATNAVQLPGAGLSSPELPPLGEAELYLPNNKTVRLVLRLGERRVYLYEGDDAIASYPVAIGKTSTPTPGGEFQVFQMIENPIWQSPWTGEVKKPGPNSALGLRWIGFAQMSNGIIGFHGTPTLSSIGRAASNGCVRMRNEDVVALFEKVEMGTPVSVVE